MAKILLILATATVVMATRAQAYEIPNYERTPLGDSIDKSSMKLLKAAYEVAQDKNVVSSPLGLMLLLSMYNAGAGAGSRDEINQFLGGNDFKQLSESYSSLSQEFSSMDSNFLTLAYKIYVASQYTPAEQLAAAARSHRSEVNTLDFTKPEDAARVINQWASEKTKGNINEPVSKDVLKPDTAAALFNVIFFRGHWHVPFKAADTQDKDFHVDTNTTVKKPTMHLLKSLYYTESQELGAKMIELPYKEKGFRMVVVLPDEVNGLPALLEKATERGLLNDVFKLQPAGRKIELDIPKFDVRSKLDFKDILPKVGVSKLFYEAAPGIVNGHPVKVTKAFQEAFIKVDEEGATAGAFTGFVAVRKSALYRPPEPLVIRVDRPFLYAILYNDKILFVGTYTK